MCKNQKMSLQVSRVSSPRPSTAPSSSQTPASGPSSHSNPPRAPPGTAAPAVRSRSVRLSERRGAFGAFGTCSSERSPFILTGTADSPGHDGDGVSGWVAYGFVFGANTTVFWRALHARARRGALAAVGRREAPGVGGGQPGSARPRPRTWLRLDLGFGSAARPHPSPEAMETARPERLRVFIWPVPTLSPEYPTKQGSPCSSISPLGAALAE